MALIEFENDVEMYGAQAKMIIALIRNEFENDVEMYGAQAEDRWDEALKKFENDVEMYGAQAVILSQSVFSRLRMM